MRTETEPKIGTWLSLKHSTFFLPPSLTPGTWGLGKYWQVWCLIDIVSDCWFVVCFEDERSKSHILHLEWKDDYQVKSHREALMTSTSWVEFIRSKNGSSMKYEEKTRKARTYHEIWAEYIKQQMLLLWYKLKITMKSKLLSSALIVVSRKLYLK